MDNRETEADNSNDTHYANAQPRPSRQWANAHQRAPRSSWAANNRRVANTGSLRSDNAAEPRPANNRQNNRDVYLQSVGRNNAGPSSSIPTVVNDLSNPRRSTDAANNLQGNGNHACNGRPNNTANADASPVNDSTVDPASRGVNVANHTRPRRRNSNNTRGGGSTRSNVAPMNARSFHQASSPIRMSNPRQRVPPLRLRGNNSPSRNPDASDSYYSRRDLSPDSPEMEAVFPSRYLRLASLDDEPSLSPAHPDFNEPAAELTDEQIARQLQQEEWERSSTPGDFSFLPSNPRRYFLDRPLRREPEPSGASANPFPVRGLRSLRFGDRQQVRNQSQSAAAELIPFIFDLFHSHGFPQEEVMNILNPDRPELPNDYEALLALAEQVGEVSRGLSQADINKLPTQKHKLESSGEESAAACGGEEPQCNICLTEYGDGDTKRLLPCHHEFHRDCVDKWLKSNATCPICRSDVKLKKP